MKSIFILTFSIIGFGCFAQMDKAYFNVSSVTTSTTLSEVTGSTKVVGKIQRIIVGLNNSVGNSFDMYLYSSNSYSSARHELYHATITTNVDIMPMYVNSTTNGDSLASAYVYDNFSLFEDYLTLATGSASGSNSSAKVTVIYERER